MTTLEVTIHLGVADVVVAGKKMKGKATVRIPMTRASLIDMLGGDAPIVVAKEPEPEVVAPDPAPPEPAPVVEEPIRESLVRTRPEVVETKPVSPQPDGRGKPRKLAGIADDRLREIILGAATNADACKNLGVSAPTLHYEMKRLGISRADRKRGPRGSNKSVATQEADGSSEQPFRVH